MATATFTVDFGTAETGQSDVTIQFMSGNTTIGTAITSGILELTAEPGVYYKASVNIPETATWVHFYRSGDTTVKAFYMLPQSGSTIPISVDLGEAEAGQTDVKLQLMTGNTTVGSALGMTEITAFPGIYYYPNLTTTGGTWVRFYRTGDATVHTFYTLPAAMETTAGFVLTDTTVDVDICNLALARIGRTQIASLTDASQAARYCNRFYHQARKEVLGCPYSWSFAKSRATLTQLSETPAFEWLYAYQLPADCIQVRRLNAYEDYEDYTHWEIEARRLLTDETTAKIVYTTDEKDTSKFSPQFVNALSLNLASKIAMPLTGSLPMAQGFLQEYQALVKPEAQHANVTQSRPARKDAYVTSRFVQSRFGI